MEDRGRGALDIAASTRKLDANDRLPLKIYYRTANTLLNQASIYREESNILDLYILLVRFCSLVTETIPEHRDYKNVPAKEKLFFKKKLAEAIPELEALKPRVQKEVERINHQHDHHVTSQFPSEWPPSTSESPENYQVVSAASSGHGHRGIDSGKLSTASFSLSTLRPRDETMSRHSYFGLQQQNKKEVHRNAAVKVQYPSYIDDSPVNIPSMAQNFSTATTFSTAEPLAMQPTGQDNSIWARPGSRLQQEIVSSRLDPYDLVAQLAPPLAATPVPPAVVAPVQAAPLTSENGQLWPSEVADPRPGSPQFHADLSGQKNPKNLHISAKMMDEFMAVARANTVKNLETCGILAGSLRKGVFNVTTLIIPKQESTSDSCQTVNEEEIFEIQDKRNLFQLGWIHTHPSQTCFMSSIDLHTHYSYQVMLNEAIAIVMAPTDAERTFGIFRLSDPGGMKVIQQCQQRGFHPHEEPIGGGAIYVHSSHVFMNPGLKFEVLDLR